MTVFISRGYNFERIISPELRVPMGAVVAGGVAVMDEKRPFLSAQFKRRPIPLASRQQALRKFRDIWGDILYGYFSDRRGTITDEDTIKELKAAGESPHYDAFRPEDAFGVFDTDNVGYDPDVNDIVPWRGVLEVPDWRDMTKTIHMQALYERELRLAPDFGREYVEITAERLAPPWKTYDTIVGQGSHDRIARIAKEIGADPTYVIAYEHQLAADNDREPRKGVIKNMEDWIAEEEIREAQQANFMAEVPGE